MPNPAKYDCYSTGLMTPEQIEDLRLHMSPSLFAANYELKHIADENVLFQEPKQGADTAFIRNAICQLDSAFYGEDYTAFSIMAYAGGKYYLFGKIWRKHVEDCYGEIMNLYNQFQCGKMYIEKNADKGMVSRDLRNIGIRTVNYTESMNKHIKISTYLKAIWADVIIVDGTDPEYIEQICDYTEEAEHDDAPDSASSLARILYPKIAKREGRRNIVDATLYEE
jgi:predicted phage terminase large subunit-like protein